MVTGSREEGFDDFTNLRKFQNQQFIDDPMGETIKYYSFFQNTSSVINARAMGKTRYFFTSSNGTIRYPSNHVSQFAEDHVYRHSYMGTLNTKPGILTSKNWTDFSSESFYRVVVRDTDNPNQPQITQGDIKIDKNGNII